MKNLFQQNKKGFTLIELILYISLTSIVLLSVSAFLIASLQARAKNRTIAEVEQAGEQVIQLITQTIRNSSAINSPAIGTSAASLSLNTSVSASNPTVFDLASGVIRITEGSGDPAPLTNSQVTASSLNFQNLSMADTPGIIRVTFILTYNNQSGRLEYDYSKTFYASASRR